MNIFIPKSILAGAAFCFIILLFILMIVLQLWQLRKKGRFSPFTEELFRLPGQSVRKEYDNMSYDFTYYYFLFVIAAMMLVGSVLLINKIDLIALPIVATAGIIYYLVKIVKLLPAVHAMRLGCEGEEYTGQELNLLMLKGAYVFHDIPYQYGNIDHVVIGNDKIFAIETKAVRKPSKSDSQNKKEATVRFDGRKLKFPHFSSSEPVDQAVQHAKFLERVIEKKCGIRFQVIPVVALPGWHIEFDGTNKSKTLIINPKRGKALHKWLGASTENSSRDRVVNYIASVARSVSPKSKLTDPNAQEFYNFWIEPRYAERLLGEEF